MRKFVSIFCIFILISISNFAQTQKTQLYVAVDGFAPAVKIGFQKHSTERLSIKGSAGFFILGPNMMSYNLFGTYIISNPEKPFGLNVNFGLLDNYIEVTTPFFSLGAGAGAGVYYRFDNSSMLTFRLGVITGPAVERYKDPRLLTIPNFGIEYAFRPRKK